MIIAQVKEGEEIYVSREELLAENPQNPKICGGMEVEFLVAKTAFDKFCACEVREKKSPKNHDFSNVLALAF